MLDEKGKNRVGTVAISHRVQAMGLPFSSFVRLAATEPDSQYQGH